MIYLNPSASKFMHCGRAFHLGVIEGWRPSTVTNNISFGSAFHLWAHLNARGDETAIAQAIKFYGSAKCVTTHNHLSSSYLINLCCTYSTKYSPYKVINHGTKDAASELAFHIPVSDDITFCGTIDNLVTDQSGKVFLRDYKTTSQSPANFFDKFRLSNQFIAYQLAISLHQKAFPNSPLASYTIAGILIEGIFLRSSGPTFETSLPFLHDQDTLDFYQSQLESFRIPENKPHGMFNGSCRTCQYFDWCQGQRAAYVQEPYRPVGD